MKRCPRKSYKVGKATYTPKPVSCRNRTGVPGDRNTFIPWETHPDWDIMTSDPTPTIYTLADDSVSLTSPTGPSAMHIVMNTLLGPVTDCDMSCIMDYEGTTAAYTTYMMAKGIDADNFVGATSYNNKIMLYERFNGNWNNPAVDVPVAGTLGKEVRVTIASDVVTLFVDGAEIGNFTTNITGAAHIGTLIREHPVTGKLFHSINFSGN